MSWSPEGTWGKIYHSFWTDPEIAQLTIGRRVLLAYYFTSPHGNLIGLYYAPFRITAHDTGLALPTVKHATLYELHPWVAYDLATSEILVRNGARALIGSMTNKDNRRKHTERVLGLVRSEALRRMFLTLYEDWGLKVPVNKEERNPSKGPWKGLRNPSQGVREGSGVDVDVDVDVDAEVEKDLSVATQPGLTPRSNNNPDGPTDGELMGLVRTFLYRPNGKAPLGYNDARDITVIRRLRKAGHSGFEIADAIEGLRLLCDRGELGRKHPGEKLTMRALYNTRHGVRPLLAQAQEAVHQTLKRAWTTAVPAAKPEHIGASVARILDAQKPVGQ